MWAWRRESDMPSDCKDISASDKHHARAHHGACEVAKRWKMCAKRATPKIKPKSSLVDENPPPSPPPPPPHHHHTPPNYTNRTYIPLPPKSSPSQECLDVLREFVGDVAEHLIVGGVVWGCRTDVERSTRPEVVRVVLA